MTAIKEDANEEYSTQNTQGLPAEFDDNQGPDPLDALKNADDPAAAMSKTTTAPETQRGTVSNELSDDEDEGDDLDKLAES